jgi:predicted ATPase
MGEGRVVLISGEPGIGKSWLTAALSERIRTQPHTRLRYFCLPHYQDTALYPFIVQLERASGFAGDSRPTIFSPRSMAGSPRASTRWT